MLEQEFHHVQRRRGSELLWSADPGLSLGDRLCLALGQRLGEQVVTADRTWGTGERVRQIH